MNGILKRGRGFIAAALIAVITGAVAIGCAQQPKDTGLTIAEIRDQASALVEVQMMLSWFSNTFGERSIIGQTYKGQEDLFSRESIATVEKGIAAASGDEKRALEFLRNYLIGEHIALRTAKYDDEISDAETTGKVTIEGVPGEVAYRDLDGMVDNEPDPAKREKIQTATARFWAEVLNPIHERKTKEEHELVAALGFDSYVQVSEQARNVNLKELIAMSSAFIEETDALYHDLFAREARAVLGKEPSEFRRSDIGRLAQVSEFNKYFPEELAMPAFRGFLENIGLTMNGVSGKPIHVDDTKRPGKDSRAVCYPIAVPDDVRFSVKPSGGVPDFDTFFHEGGHAVHFANATTDVWEFQQLGNNTVTEAYSGLYEGLWGDPDWLKWYREFVRDYNRFAPFDQKVPLMTDEEIARLVQNRAFWDLYYTRRYAGAKLVYETVLHGGDPAIYEGQYDGNAGDNMQEVYRQLFSKAYGFEMTDEEALRFRTDVDPFFYSADYARSYALAKQMHEGLSTKFGDPWWRSPEAGAFMLSDWFAPANKLYGDEVAQMLGYDKLSYEPLARDIEKRLQFVQSILGE
ncbi:MAG: hypothetical protein HKN20_15450 [Gemmatimonadetes bacterium]|nr:hypothetical protein [Gemmatimonadota bacterium]